MLIDVLERTLCFPASALHRIFIGDVERKHHGGVQVAQLVECHYGDTGVFITRWNRQVLAFPERVSI